MTGQSIGKGLIQNTAELQLEAFGNIMTAAACGNAEKLLEALQCFGRRAAGTIAAGSPRSGP